MGRRDGPQVYKNLGGTWASYVTRQEHYARWLGYSDSQLAKGNPARGRILRFVREDSDFKFWYRELRFQEGLMERGRADLRPDGAYARALEMLGYRSAGNPFKVGDTPRVRKARH